MEKANARQLLITFLPSVSVLMVVMAVNVFMHVEMVNITRDVAAIANIHPLAGFLSNLGILLWCATASISLFAAIVCRHNAQQYTFWFLLCSGLLSAYLMLDDFFQFHEVLAYEYLGLREGYVIAGLGISASAYLLAFRRVIARTNFGVLLLALGFLGASVGMDVIQVWLTAKLGADFSRFLEEGAKWLGIAVWCSYYLRTSHQLLVGTPRLIGNRAELG